MERRDALKLMGGTLAYGFAASSLASVFVACKTDPSVNWKPGFFSEDQAYFIEELTEIILPATDTPGAKEAGVTKEIDSYINSIMLQEEKDEIQEQLLAFTNFYESDSGKLFEDATPEERTAWVQEFANTVPEGEPTDAQKFFGTLKGMAISGYFSSELIAENHLAYESIPGEQQGCISLEEASGGLNWAL